MNLSDSGILQALLVGHVREMLRGSGTDLVDEEAAKRVIQQVLFARRLAPEELAALGELAGGSAWNLDQLIALRLERALGAAAASVAERAGIELEVPPPRVALVRGEEGGCSQTVGPGLGRAAGLSGSGVGAGGRDSILVVCDGEALADLRSGRTVSLGARTLSVDAQGLGLLDDGEVTICEAAEGLAQLESALADLAPTLAPDAPAPAPIGEEMIGTRIAGKYRIVRLLGRGGFGAVYEARDEILDNPVAIKLLNPEVARNERNLSAFRSEAQRVTRLRHSNIVDWKVFDQMDDGRLYFVMELLRGEELSDVLAREGKLPAERAIPILLQILDALTAAHHLAADESVVHLDLKPQNVFVMPERAPGGFPEWVKVIDFGIGQFLGRAEEGYGGSCDDSAGDSTDDPFHLHSIRTQVADSTPAPNGTSVTRCTACTPEYCSPEQAAHVLGHEDIRPLDGRSDLYSFGIMAYQMLTGELPYPRPRQRLDWLRIHREDRPRPIRSVDKSIPRRLAAFVDRCLRKDPDDRWRSTEEAYEAFERIVQPRLALASRVGVLGVLSAVVIAAVYLLPGRVEAKDPWQPPASLVSFGPEKTFVAIDRSFDRGTELRLEDRWGNDLRNDGWTVELNEVDAGRSEARLRAPTIAEYRRWNRVRVVALHGNETSESDRFDVEVVPTDCIAISEIRVPGAEDRSVHPREMRLEVGIDLAAPDDDLVRHVEIESPEWGRKPLNHSRKKDSTVYYSLPLDELKLPAGSTHLAVTVVDRAGGIREDSIDLSIVDGPLAKSGDPWQLDVEHSRNERPLVQSRTAAVKAKVARPANWTVQVLHGSSKQQVLNTFDAESDPGDLKWRDSISFLLDLDLKSGRDWSGSIRIVADENVYVAHQDSSDGIVKDEIYFDFTLQLPQLELELDDASLADGDSRYVNRDPKLFASVPDDSVPCFVTVRVRDQEPATKEVRPRSPERFPLSIPRDGPFPIVVEVRRFEELDPTEEWAFEIIVDRVRPVVTITGESADLVSLVSRTATFSTLRALLEPEVNGDEASTFAGTPVTLDLRFEDPFGEVHPLDSLDVEPGGEGSVVTFDPPWDAMEESRDGNWKLVVTGKDKAGNPLEGPPPVHDFEVAMDGPEIEFRLPKDDGRKWIPTGDHFELEALIEDRNHVREAMVRIVHANGSAVTIQQQLQHLGDASERWKTDPFTLPRGWSGKSVTVSIAAEDEQGNHSERRLSVQLGEFERVLPPELVDRKRPELTKLVRIPSFRKYIAFGRKSDDRDYEKVGLDPPPTAWAVPCDETPEFFIEKREVTRGQFLSFLEDGYLDAEHWRSGVAPSASRREELLEHLSASSDLDLDLPVADVDWYEAAAYAHWAGRRLPTVLEWEVAVRGGLDYRPYASWTPGRSNPSPAEINHGSDAPWPAGRGEDVTPEGIRDLCGNVAEWTSSLYGRPRYADEIRAPVIRPGAPVWRVGGSFAMRVFDVLSTPVPSSPTDHQADLGFRCVMDKATADAAFDDGRLAEAP